jgi:hypothetical protein
MPPVLNVVEQIVFEYNNLLAQWIIHGNWEQVINSFKKQLNYLKNDYEKTLYTYW